MHTVMCVVSPTGGLSRALMDSPEYGFHRVWFSPAVILHHSSTQMSIGPNTTHKLLQTMSLAPPRGHAASKRWASYTPAHRSMAASAQQLLRQYRQQRRRHQPAAFGAAAVADAALWKKLDDCDDDKHYYFVCGERPANDTCTTASAAPAAKRQRHGGWVGSQPNIPNPVRTDPLLTACHDHLPPDILEYIFLLRLAMLPQDPEMQVLICTNKWRGTTLTVQPGRKMKVLYIILDTRIS